ncbi:hypothetical protein [Mucilaginibacter pocheonensis]|uniref:Nicotinamide mononucleotide adenylyltransferase n=1 Tax=Mucilaginibacter pocheonensis TaxID=398050 RepID=A0ABU1TJN5_9SPHI|nr:hypothetical protein [Mucilaginibacter pocheonensis]MDR6945075.1 nicotinamide mononucleotide adenylyltransferase [Mucilaginibacter pocheonensis]
MKTAVIIARFQTPYLHNGHKQLINTVKENHAKLIILLGVSPIMGSRKNPYDYYTREKNDQERLFRSDRIADKRPSQR